MRCDSFSSDITQSLSSITYESGVPKKRKLKKKKRHQAISPKISDSPEIQVNYRPIKNENANESLEVQDYEDSEFYQEEVTEGDDFNFKTAKKILKEKSKYFLTETAVDELYGGRGIKAGDIIEVCGRHQVGKTLLVTSLALNVLTKYPESHIAFIDTKNDIQTVQLRRMLKLRGHDEDTIHTFFNRILLFNASNLFEFIDTLKTIIKGQSDYSNVSFIFIDSITVPFYHDTGNIRLTHKMTSEVHQLIFELAKTMNKVVMFTNLQLHVYKISESDDSMEESDSSSSATSSVEDEETYVPKSEDITKDVRPALGNYWSEILDSRILISMSETRETDVLGFIEVKRRLTLLESKNLETLNSRLVNITDTGVM